MVHSNIIPRRLSFPLFASLSCGRTRQPLQHRAFSSRRRASADTKKKMASGPSILEKEGVRVAVEGCGHGALNPIYAAVKKACAERGWPGVDLLIIGGDFQAVRNGHDVEVMSVPAKYRALGDFHEYYSGARQAPYLTLFIGGNHEAAAHLAELYYGGWVAPNIYYMGAANVLRLGPLRIAGLSGICKGSDYRKTHYERLPFNSGDVKSFYHVREFDVRKLLQIREQVDVGLSHDWPRHIEKLGNVQELYRLRPMWKRESQEGTLGSFAAEYVMDRLRPAYWFSAHMHWQYTAIKEYPPSQPLEADGAFPQAVEAPPAPAPDAEAAVVVEDPNEIDLDMGDDDDAEPALSAAGVNGTDDSSDPAKAAAATTEEPSTTVPDDLRAQLPAAFNKPKPATGPKGTPGQPVPPTITNRQTRFLALSKCEPHRHFLHVCDLHPVNEKHLLEYPPSETPNATPNENDNNDDNNKTTTTSRYTLQYDPEWLAITRAFHPLLTIGDRTALTPPDEGEASYRAQIDRERAWVEANIVSPSSSQEGNTPTKSKLDIPHNFTPTAPALTPSTRTSHPDLWSLHSNTQPSEHTNPQTAAYCTLLGVPNLWDASEEERAERRKRGPPREDPRFGGDGGRGGGYRGGRGGGGRGGGGRGGWGRGGRGGRGRGRGRG